MISQQAVAAGNSLRLRASCNNWLVSEAAKPSSFRQLHAVNRSVRASDAFGEFELRQ